MSSLDENDARRPHDAPIVFDFDLDLDFDQLFECKWHCSKSTMEWNGTALSRECGSNDRVQSALLLGGRTLIANDPNFFFSDQRHRWQLPMKT
jgi:hypothetical protein